MYLTNRNFIFHSICQTPAPEFLCPVCREELDANSIDIEKLLDSPPPRGEELEDDELLQPGDSLSETDVGRKPKISLEWIQQREQMKELYEKQERQGGIIDLSEKTKLLIISTPSPTNSTSTTAEESSPISGASVSPPSDLNSSSSFSSTASSNTMAAVETTATPTTTTTIASAVKKEEPENNVGKLASKDVNANAKFVGGHYHRSHKYRDYSHHTTGATHNESSFKSRNSQKSYQYSKKLEFGAENTVASKESATDKQIPGTEKPFHKRSLTKNQQRQQYAPKQSLESKTGTSDNDRTQAKTQLNGIAIATSATATTVTGDVKTDLQDEKDETTLAQGRIRNFSRHHHYHHSRGHHYYNNHHSRGYAPKKHNDHSNSTASKPVADQ